MYKYLMNINFFIILYKKMYSYTVNQFLKYDTITEKYIYLKNSVGLKSKFKKSIMSRISFISNI